MPLEFWRRTSGSNGGRTAGLMGILNHLFGSAPFILNVMLPRVFVTNNNIYVL